MAPIADELATLKALTFRISSTPTSQLPQHVPAIAASLANCKTILSSAQASGSKTASEGSVALHKYRTLLSTLLQDRTIQGRWAAIVLIKSTIEIGGWETLHKSLPWVRGLLGILTKPDPPSSKQFCIITLTRIFTLTREYPTLIREITTPSLPAFIQSALQVANSKAPSTLLQTVLESLNQLLSRHPTVFRSYLKPIQNLLAQTIAPTPSSKLSPEQASPSTLYATSTVSAAARRMYTQLSCSAPKGATSEEWQASLKKTVSNTHRVADKVFRAVVEDWKPVGHAAPATNGQTLDDEVNDRDVDAMSLPPWSGIFAGGERLVALLDLVSEFILCPTAGPVTLNIGAVLELITRMLSLTIPSSANKGFQQNVRFNNQVSKEERDNLWSILPQVHVAAINILLALTQRSASGTLAIDLVVLDQLVWVFSTEKDIAEVRTACYSALKELLFRSGTTLPKATVDSLGEIIRRCCEDILPTESSGPSSQQPIPKANGAQPSTTNADSFLSSKAIKQSKGNFAGLEAAAHSLLPVLLAHIRAHYISDSLRSRMDRTAILAGHEKAMMASVLNPPQARKFGKPTASILPFLARHSSTSKEAEALLRPRMPIVQTGIGEEDGEGEDEEMNEEEQEVEEDDEEDAVHHDDGQVDATNDTTDTRLDAATAVDNAADDVSMEDASINTAPPATLADSATANAFANSDHPERLKTTAKRAQEDHTPLSPPKRAKVGGASPYTPVLSQETSLSHDTSSAPVSQSLHVTARSVSAVPTHDPVAAAAAPPVSASTSASLVGASSTIQETIDEDSDDEDIVPLVFGQDTDDESE